MNRRNHPGLCVALVLLALGLALFPRLGRAQPIEVKGPFKSAEYYTNSTKMKSLLEGASALPQPDGRVLVTEAKYRTFRTNSEVELNVEALQCLYDERQKTISSSGPLRMQIANGKFSIEGEGFLYYVTNSALLVSNRVHTVLHPDLLGPQAATSRTNVPAEATPGIDIFSDQFEYAEKTGLGVYQGNVRVAGTNLASTEGRLTIVLLAAEHRLQSLLAEQNVIADYEKIHATGDRAFYSAETDIIRLTGQPTWRIEDRNGSGDELVFDRTNRVLHANGHARLKTPPQGMGASLFSPQSSSNSATSLPPTNQFIEILCANYQLRTNLAVFRDQVKVTDRLGDEIRGEMSCGLMTLTFTGTNEFQTMVAEHQVVIAQTNGQFTAERAEYTSADGLLNLDGKPAWREGTREGKGDRMRLNLAREEMLVRGSAFMRLPAAELGQSAFAALGTNQQVKVKVTTNEFAEIYSTEYLLTPAAALFRGNVRIEHPQIKETCQELTMLSLPELGKAGRMVIAEPAVVFDVVDDEGRNFHGTGEKAVYTHRTTSTLTNDMMELTGHPAVLEATNVVGRNDIITLDLTSHKLMAPGKYNIVGAMPATAVKALGHQPNR
ncbi:MAG: LptA/OstA family protein [Limisphaerales bacterium]